MDWLGFVFTPAGIVGVLSAALLTGASLGLFTLVVQAAGGRD